MARHDPRVPFAPASQPRSRWAGMARQRCSDCGSSVVWGIARDLPWEVQPGDRLRAFELIGYCGETADAWACKSCGNFGVFDGGGVM